MPRKEEKEDSLHHDSKRRMNDLKDQDRKDVHLEEIRNLREKNVKKIIMDNEWESEEEWR